MDVRKALMSSVDEVLDKMAFMFFDELDPEEIGQQVYKYTTMVTFEGAITGGLNIMVTEGVARNIARNLLGIRDEDDLFADTLNDAMCEFTNIVMGRTMTILRQDGRFDMTVPQIVDAPAQPDPDQQSERIEGALDDEAVCLIINFKETPGWTPR
ncbi:MAG: chemotaxis protein CheX [Deltaproteobacteria bacterium]|nr:chemotaxis protein CheX [Deltaproteobacteria bacterium]